MLAVVARLSVQVTLLSSLILYLQLCQLTSADAYSPIIMIFRKFSEAEEGMCELECRARIKELETALKDQPNPCWQDGAQVCLRSGWKLETNAEIIKNFKKVKIQRGTSVPSKTSSKEIDVLGPTWLDVIDAMVNIAQCASQVPVSISYTQKGITRHMTSALARLSICSGRTLAETAVSSLMKPRPDPGASKPGTSKAGTSRPGSSKPGLSPPRSTKPDPSNPESNKRKQRPGELCYCTVTITVQSSIFRAQGALILFLSLNEGLRRREFGSGADDAYPSPLTQAILLNDECRWEEMIKYIESKGFQWHLIEYIRPNIDFIIEEGIAASDTFRVLGAIDSPSKIAEPCWCPPNEIALQVCSDFRVDQKPENMHRHPICSQVFSSASSSATHINVKCTRKGKEIIELL